MIPLSTRYLLHIATALLLTLIPVVLHSYNNLQSDDCVSVSAMFADCNYEPDREATARRLAGFFGEVNWCAGVLSPHGTCPSLSYWILRSHDPKKLYHMPEIGFVRGVAPLRRITEELSWENGTVPVHRVYYPDNEEDIYVAYILIYNSEAVANPYMAQILSFPRQLMMGVAPINLMFITGRGPQGTLEEMEEEGGQWLIESLRRYRLLCGRVE